ncbi:choice-of-anchor D domain-containing protein [Pseudolysobacter antarcticus]|uniref:Choice-of-anchor D domain-containing protein n=1 Tax=Pseudolysobacter antarcticus TaxID=2511995 RepID=A0A411HEW2_9GAMM|nr:choice-of-anchor D domain-containing protein [Pseudolysobacter antarcticus]QBB69026.1 choice-of-anchor D domain-containing protein [Pseudolysobacter antarcticus]
MISLVRCFAVLGALSVTTQGFAQTAPKPVLANIGPVSVDFGAIKMGDTVSVPITIQNISSGTVSIASTGINGVAQFAMDSATCASKSYMIVAGDSCYLTIKFTPTDAGGTTFSTTTAVLVQSGSITQIAQLHFSGSGTEALVEVTPVAIDFGDTFIGQQVMVPVTIRNTHKATITQLGGSAGNATFDAGTDCGGPTVPVDPCHVYYTFTPSVSGPAQANADITIATSQPTSMSQDFPISLKGNGVATFPSPNVAAWPVGIDFGRIKVGHTATVPFLYRNNSPGYVTTAGGGFNDNNGPFQGFSHPEADCMTATFAPGVTCHTDYQFLARAQQVYAGSTDIFFFTPPDQYVVPYAFSGTGVGTLARVTPQTVDLGTVAFGTSASVPVVITNTSDNPLSNFTGGQMNTPFNAVSNCPTSLSVGQSCSYTYTFTTPSPQSSLKASYTATTLLSFNNIGSNSNGIQPIVQIQITAHVGDRIFGDGFNG